MGTGPNGPVPIKKKGVKENRYKEVCFVGALRSYYYFAACDHFKPSLFACLIFY